MLLEPKISLGQFSLAVFVRVTHDGLSEKGTTRSLMLLIFPLLVFIVQKN